MNVVLGPLIHKLIFGLPLSSAPCPAKCSFSKHEKNVLDIRRIVMQGVCMKNLNVFLGLSQKHLLRYEGSTHTFKELSSLREAVKNVLAEFVR